MSGGVILLMQDRCIRSFQKAGAISPDAANTLEQLGCRDSWVFRRMVAKGVFVQAREDTYYMDEAAAQEYVCQRTNPTCCQANTTSVHRSQTESTAESPRPSASADVGTTAKWERGPQESTHA
jgi:hypothetical protein